ncbi:MAG: 3-hydroxyacyl-ACP dehydratase FabZ [Armatimonadetes bacterium]|nr:3-hydroxyacyl-ACP dehydratase FabZ [Armatimonadota bacterium]
MAPPLFPNPEITDQYQGRTLDIEAIQLLLPHRPPFLMLDRVIELDPAKSAVGIKCVTMNEWFFVGHYPEFPVMPGVLILEALAQLAGVVVMTGMERGAWVPLFTGVEKAKFRRPVRPGDVLRLEVTILSVKPRFGRLMSEMNMRALVDGQLVTEATCSFALVNREQ